MKTTIDYEAHRAAQEEILKILGINEFFMERIIEHTIDQFNRGGNRWFSRSFVITRKRWKLLRSKSNDVIETAVTERLDKDSRISSVSSEMGGETFVWPRPTHLYIRFYLN